MITLNLTWHVDAIDKNQNPIQYVITAGSNPVVLATLTKRTKLWEIYMQLTDCEARPTYGQLDKQMLNAETCIRHWFALAFHEMTVVPVDPTAAVI